jgi:hypothetical protein
MSSGDIEIQTINDVSMAAALRNEPKAPRTIGGEMKGKFKGRG